MLIIHPSRCHKATACGYRTTNVTWLAGLKRLLAALPNVGAVGTSAVRAATREAIVSFRSSQVFTPTAFSSRYQKL